jgi:hypothetical protein
MQASQQVKKTPRNAEYTEIRRKVFPSATLGVFGETRRIAFPVWLRPWPA